LNKSAPRGVYDDDAKIKGSTSYRNSLIPGGTLVRIRLIAAAITAGLIASLPVTTAAHFKLLEPASWLVENALGDPQKLAPCGSAPAAGPKAPAVALSNVVTKVQGGSTLHLKIAETIYHPGHYRVALAVNSRNELPPDPVTFERTTERGPYSVWAVIQSPPQIPVLADGLFPHYTRPARPQGATAEPVIYETDIQLPNLTCAKCTLQVLQFMAEHAYNQPGGYSYHHCADLQITADPARPIDQKWPVG
jgi:hypothetical protein